MIRKAVLFLSFILIFSHLYAQPSYTINDYAGIHQAQLISNANQLSLLIYDFSETGENFQWDFYLTGISSQESLEYIGSDESGYRESFLLSCVLQGNDPVSCAGLWDQLAQRAIRNFKDTLSFSGISLSNMTDIYSTTGDVLSLNMRGMSVDLGTGAMLPLAVPFDEPEIIYAFPFTYGKSWTDQSRFVIDLRPLGQDFVYITNTSRESEVDGWGSLRTPFRDFEEVIRLKTTINYEDSLIMGDDIMAIDRPQEIIYEWFSPEFGFPVYKAVSTNILGLQVNSSAQFADSLRCLEPSAIFAFYPPLPQISEKQDSVEVNFYNLSNNADVYHWNFGDPGSASNISGIKNPTHYYSQEGTYAVQLVVQNTLCDPQRNDTIALPISISKDNTAINGLLSSKVKVSPVPAQNRIKIDVEKLLSNHFTVHIFDLQGRLIKKEELSGGKSFFIDIENLPNGLYVLSIQTGDEIINKKIIKD